MGLIWEVKTSDKENIGETVESLGGHPLYLSSLWRAIYNESTVYHFIVRNEREILLTGLGVVKEKRKYLFLKNIRSIHIPFAPLLKTADPAVSDFFLQELIRFGRGIKANAIELDWRYCYQSNFDGNIFKKYTRELKKRIEFIIDLDRNAEELLGSYAPEKSNFKRARKNGLDFEFGNTFEDLNRLREMQTSSLERAAGKENFFSLPDEEYYRLVYQSCVRPGHSKMIFATREGKKISGLMYLFSRNRAVIQRGGSTKEAFPLGASRYLHYSLIWELKNQGYKDIFFGGVPGEAVVPEHPEHGLYLFKKGFPVREIPAYLAKINV